ncbi:MAG: RagB/SusD family nutrient uptake outer membrane protein [Bacteroidales bacterium]|nr:RagB/SusD family nutrient uptake outer membrane protein [Bacteroidales bacterium]
MKLRYIIASILGASALLLAASCSKNLDIPQHSVVSIDDFYQTDTEAEEAIVAAYYQFKTVHSGGTSSAAWLMNFLGDELWVGGGSRADGTYYQYSEFTFTDGNGVVKNLYAGLYTLIYRCNLVIERVTGDSAVMKRARAEALTMRAWANFELVTLWGTAPLVDHILNQDEYLQGNSESVSVLWNAIETDLNEAISSGALTDVTGTYRLTKAFAQAMLGKAQLWQNKYSEAAATFDQIINSGKFSLQTDLKDFGTIRGDVTAEDLFCMRGIDDASNSGPNATYHGMWTGLRAEKYEYNYDKSRPATANFATYPFGFQVNVTKSLYDKFLEVEGADGYRLNNFVLTYQQMQDEFNTRVKEGMSIYDCEGLFNRKYMIWKDNGSAYRYPLPDHIMRYDEVLCFAAEAQFQAGNQDKALNYINQLRTRAQAPQATSIDLQVIKDESWMELCFEGLRYQNLLRWGEASARLSNRGATHPELQPDGTVNYVRYNADGTVGFKTGKHELLPFPADEMAVNPNMTQNQGW